jgi:hypothetical protein
VLFVALLGLAGAIMCVRAALRQPENWTLAAWLLFVVTAMAGAVWWFAGAGRPPGLAPGALLGLWPVDAAGVLFWLAGAGTIILLGTDRTPAPYQPATTACLAIIGLVLAQSAVTVSGLWSTHLIMLLPLPQLVMAAFAVRLGARLARSVRNTGGTQGAFVRATLGVAPALLLVSAVAFYDLRVGAAYHRDMAQTGGISTFSDSIYSLAGYLDREAAGRKVVALDWGIKRPVQFLTLDRINPDDAYGYEQTPSQATIDGIRARVAQPDTLFLFRSPEAGVAYPRFDIFTEAARAIGKQPVLERTFYTRDGGRVYEVYSVR